MEDVHIHIHTGGQDEILARIDQLGVVVADLQTAIAELTTAVQGVVDRVGPTVDELRAQVAAGLTALADFQAADALEDSDYEAAAAALQAALQGQVDAAQAAADAIEGNIVTLNQVAAAPAGGGES